MGSTALLNIFGRLGQTPRKPSCSCLWARSGWPVTPSLQDPRRKDLGVMSPNQTWLLLGAGSRFPAYHCGYGRQRIHHQCLMTLPSGRSAKNAPCFLGVGCCPPLIPSKAWWQGWTHAGISGGICWRAWWGRIPHATTLLFWAMDRDAELDLSQLQPIFCPYRNISQTLMLCPSRCHVSGRPLCIPLWTHCRCSYPSSNLRAEVLLLKVLEHFASLH